MENASKALYIVVGVILGLLLLTVMIYVFRQGARVNAAYDQKQITNQLELYNARFEQFDRDNNSIIDVISLCNAAFDVNMSTDYDSQNSIEVEIVIGNKVFKIPNHYCGTCKNDLNINFKDRKCKGCGKEIFVNRNMILNGTTQMSIYDLANVTLNKLAGGVSNIKQEYSLFPERFRPQNPTGKTQVAVSSEAAKDTLSITKLKKDSEGRVKTAYKYLFARVADADLQYNSVNMKISKIRLTAYCNSEWRDDV